MKNYILFLLIILAAVSVFAADTTAPATVQTPVVINPTLPETATITRIVVVSNPFDATNCYLIVNKKHEAIAIDTADELKYDPDSKSLLHLATRETRAVKTADIKNDMDYYGQIYTDPVTAKQLLVYDRYKATGVYAQKILDELKRQKAKLKYIVLSHGHIDHIGATQFLVKKTGAKVLMHEADVRKGNPKDTHMFVDGQTKVDRTLVDGEILTLGDMSFRVIATPGHSLGAICLYTVQKDQPILFSGDTLLSHSGVKTYFRDGSGDLRVLLKTLEEKIFTLPANTIVKTGHYEDTTVGYEKDHNPYLPPKIIEPPIDVVPVPQQ